MQTEHPGSVAPIFVSVKEAARILSISNWSMYQLLDRDDSPVESQYHGRRRLVRLSSLTAYADSLPTTPPSAEESA